ncbi:MAG: 1-phosphofructokinase family hexose kinase [Lachnospiraceae bacterium]|nr:1-phosphofructokinase family hexose kinase [Lachnospiraceae bacterium]
MILCVSLNPAVDKMLKINTINIGKVNRASLESVHAGGKAVNVAFDLQLQGEEVFVTGFVGGKCGRMILDELKQRNMPNKFVMLSTETRTNMNYIDSFGKVTEILEGGHLVDAKSEEMFLHLYMNLIKKADMAVLSGSLPIGLNDDFYGSLTDIANRAGVPVCLDASGNALSEAVLHQPFLIKPNLSEFEGLTNHKYDLSALDKGFKEFFESASFKNVMLEDLMDLRKAGIAIICVTLGDKGMLLYAKDQIIVCNAPEVEVVNTVGSGDCMLSSLIHSLMKNVSILDCAVYASAVSSAHVNTLNVGDIDPELVSKLSGKVKYGIFRCPKN